MDDLISRQAALDAIDKNRDALLSLSLNSAEHILVHYGRRVIEELPTIDPKRGRWEDVEEDEGEWICFKCSECGHDAYSYTGEIISNEWKFCPYCGARMSDECTD